MNVDSMSTLAVLLPKEPPHQRMNPSEPRRHSAAPDCLQDKTAVDLAPLASRVRALLYHTIGFEEFFAVSQAIFPNHSKDELTVVQDVLALGTSLCHLYNLLPSSVRGAHRIKISNNEGEVATHQQRKIHTMNFIMAARAGELFKAARVSDIHHTPLQAVLFEKVGKALPSLVI